MLKKILCTFLIFINLLTLSGCWGYKEINDLPIVIGASIDKVNEEEYLLGVEVLKTTEAIESSKEIKKILLQSTGKTVFDALRKLLVKSGKFLYWANIKIILIGKDIAEEDLVSVLDLLHRDIEVRSEADVIIAKDKGIDILRANDIIDEPTSIHLFDLMENSKKLSKIYPLKLSEVIDTLGLEGKDFILPMISFKDIDEKDAYQELESAIFKGNKMIGTLNGDEVQTFRLLSNEEKGGIRTEVISLDSNTKVSFEIEKSSSKIRPVYEDGQITMNIYITTNVFIAEVMNYQFDIGDEKVRSYMREKLEETINEKSKEFLQRIQGELNSDLLGYGHLVRRKYPSVWKRDKENWNKIFPSIRTNIYVKANFKGSAQYTKIV